MTIEEITLDEYHALQAKPKSKFRNVRTEIDGFVFDSKAEARHYLELRLREKAGEIEGLALQPKFDLVVNGVKVGRYIADFIFMDIVTNERVVVDVKGMRTPVYQLKKRLMKALHNIEIKEVK